MNDPASPATADPAIVGIIRDFTPDDIVKRLDELSEEQVHLERELDLSREAMELFRNALKATGNEGMWP